MIDPLKPEKFYTACDLRQFPFQTTNEIEGLTDILGNLA